MQTRPSNRAIFFGALAALAALLLFADYALRDKNEAQEQESSPVCGANDAACRGRRLSAGVQIPCSTAVTQLLQFEPEWTDRNFERRFDGPTWYAPGESIVFTGRSLLAMNAFGAKQRVQYFCVVDARNGRVLQTGIPTLSLRSD